jgi:hypothetical protein
VLLKDRRSFLELDSNPTSEELIDLKKNPLRNPKYAIYETAGEW